MPSLGPALPLPAWSADSIISDNSHFTMGHPAGEVERGETGPHPPEGGLWSLHASEEWGEFL